MYILVTKEAPDFTATAVMPSNQPKETMPRKVVVTGPVTSTATPRKMTRMGLNTGLSNG